MPHLYRVLRTPVANRPGSPPGRLAKDPRRPHGRRIRPEAPYGPPGWRRARPARLAASRPRNSAVWFDISLTRRVSGSSCLTVPRVPRSVRPETVRALAALAAPAAPGLRHRDFLDTVASTDAQFRQPCRLCLRPPSSRAGSSTASPSPFHVKHCRVAVIATGLGVVATVHDVGARETGPTVSIAPASCTGRLSDVRCEASACALNNGASRRRRVVTL